MLTIKIKRVSHTHHKLEYIRENGSGETTELETKTFLMHDFIHFCVEKEAGLKDGFYGLLEKGCTYASLSFNEKGDTNCKVTEEIERVTGAMTGIMKEMTTPSELMKVFHNMYNAYNELIPEWLNENTIQHAHDRYKRIMGEWNSLKFGETLTLIF